MRWLNGPIGLGAESRVLRVGCRTVLVVVPFVVAGTRLLDVLPLLESDHRLQVVFAVPPTADGATCHGAEEFLRAHGCLVLPWHQAVRHEFDLVLAASPAGVSQLYGRVLLMPHGAGSVRPLLRARAAGATARPSHDLDREALMRRGRLVPSAIALAHDSELAVLRHSCPDAVPVAEVAGDICYDRLTASTPYRDHYRSALGVGREQKLVTVTSTWQPESTLGQHPDLLDRLLKALPSNEYRVAAILHPNIWSVHGAWQVRAWLASCLAKGLLLIPPEEGWRAALVAADLVIGDYGSVTRYGVALGAPTLLAALPERDIRPGSAANELGRRAPRLRPDRQLVDQIDAAAVDRSWQDGVPQRITSRPGQAGALLRRTMYRLLELPEPARAAPVSPVPLPNPITGQPWTSDA
jgi:hypothetical protein